MCPASNQTLIERAAKRTEWAATALSSAADDLSDASYDGSLEGLAELVEHHASVIAHLANDVRSRRYDGDEPAFAGKDGGLPNSRAAA